jgi:Ca2+-binding RTX toxin-like protein
MLGVLGLFAVTLLGLAIAPGARAQGADGDDDIDEGDDLVRSDMVEGQGFLNLDEDDDAEDSVESADPGQGDTVLPENPALPGEDQDALDDGIDAEDVDPDAPEWDAAEWDAVLTGTDGGEWMAGTAGRDLIDGMGGDDHLSGGEGDDSLLGRAGRDELRGGYGNDALDGGEGDDDLFGEMGDDLIAAGAGNDQLNGGDGADVLDGGAGDDSLLGSWGDDVLDGGAGADVLNGGDGADLLTGVGDATRDYLNGGEGDDVLLGGAGDNLNGGGGADQFQVGAEDGAPVVVDDFDRAEDALVVVYDGSGPEPALTQVAQDGGVVLLADGVEVAQVLGVEEIDMSMIRLVAA